MTVLETERKNLKTLSDEELVKAAQNGDNEALEAILSRYKNLVYAKSKPYFLAGADDDDIIQEGLIGLYKAVMDFDGDRFPFFKVFAGVCVTRHIITAVKAASRKKHLPLNSYVSLDKNTYDDDSDTTLLDIIAFSELQDPEAILIDRENMDGMEYKINKVLSKLETEVLVYYLEGLSYQEIAEELDLHESTISRVTNQKYMATPRGIFELKYFFGSHVATEAGGACSATAIRALIKQLVGAENARKPLSDSEITELLGQQGIVVARRTIAKYRESLGIPPVKLRRTL